MDNVKHHSWTPGPDTASCESWLSPISCWCPLSGNESVGFARLLIFMTKYMSLIHGCGGQRQEGDLGIYTACFRIGRTT